MSLQSSNIYVTCKPTLIVEPLTCTWMFVRTQSVFCFFFFYTFVCVLDSHKVNVIYSNTSSGRISICISRIGVSYTDYFNVPCINYFQSIYHCSNQPFLIQIDSDKTIMVTLKHEGKLQVNSECAFQVCRRIYMNTGINWCISLVLTYFC